MYRKIFALIITGILAISPLGLTADAITTHKSTKADSKQELNVGLYVDPSTLDFQKALPVTETEIYEWCMEGLTRSDGVNNVKPGIAERWTTSSNGKVWTFYLRDALWSDGKAVTAQDFVTGILRALDPKYDSPRNYLLWDIKDAYEYNHGEKKKEDVGVRAIDDKTLQVSLDYPVAYFDTLVSTPWFSPIRNDILERDGGTWNKDIEHMVVTGPFQIKSRIEGDRLVFEKNQKYWDKDAIKLEKINALVMTDEAAEEELFASNKLDVMLRKYKGNEPLKNAEEASYHDGTIGTMEFNCSDKIMKNKNIRRAIALATNRSKLVGKIKETNSKPALALINPMIIRDLPNQDFRSQSPTLFKDADVALAKESLAKGLKELKLKKCPDLGLLISESDDNIAIANSIADDLKDNLGVHLEITVKSDEVVRERKNSHRFQMTLWFWYPDYPDAIGALYMLKSNSVNNDCLYKSKRFDQLVDQADSSLSVEKRSKLLHEAEVLLMQDMPTSPLYYNYSSYAVKKYVKNLTRGAFGPDLNLIYAYIEGKN